MGHKKKARNWEDIDGKVRDKIEELREKEKEFKDRSGYPKWVKYFSIGSVFYSLVYYQFYFKKQTMSRISGRTLFYLFSPIVVYGFTLMKAVYDKEAFRNYYVTHIELNRIIKKSSESNHYG
jgi:hypothetical protein